MAERYDNIEWHVFSVQYAYVYVCVFVLFAMCSVHLLCALILTTEQNYSPIELADNVTLYLVLYSTYKNIMPR